MVRAFPVILPMLADGRLNLSTLRLLAVPDVDNHHALLDQMAHRAKREVEEQIVRWFPKPDVATSIRKLPEQEVVAAPAATVAIEHGGPGGDGAHDAVRHGEKAREPAPPAVARAATPSSSPPHRPVIEPLAADRYLIKFTGRDPAVQLRAVQPGA